MKRAVLAKVKEVRPDGSAVLEPLTDLATWRCWYSGPGDSPADKPTFPAPLPRKNKP